MPERGARQTRGDPFAERLLEHRQGFGRQFLGAQLDEEIAPLGAGLAAHVPVRSTGALPAANSGKPSASRLA